MPLVILHLEDNEADAVLIRAALEEAGFECAIDRVDSRGAFFARLKTGGLDLILADHGLPGFDGIGALAIAHELCPDVPFIFVTGAMGEEIAIETLTHGATDYVLKHRMSRLAPAVRRALHEVARRTAQSGLELALQRSRRLDAVGRFAETVAGEFDHLLKSILAQVGTMRGRLADPAGLETLGEIESAAVRGTSLARHMLEMSRHAGTAGEVEIEDVARAMEQTLRRLMVERTDIVLSLATMPTSIGVDVRHLDQILLVLALDVQGWAGPGAALRIETGQAAVGPGHPRMAPGSYATLSVKASRSVLADVPTERAATLGVAALDVPEVGELIAAMGGYLDLSREIAGEHGICLYFPCASSARVGEPLVHEGAA